MTRWSEVLCEGVEDLLNRKSGACDSVAVGTWHLSASPKTRNSSMQSLKCTGLQWISSSLPTCTYAHVPIPLALK